MTTHPDDAEWREMTTREREQWTWDHRHDTTTRGEDWRRSVVTLPAFTAAELDELGRAVTSRLAEHARLGALAHTQPGIVMEQSRICQSLATAIAEARYSLR